MSLYDADRHLLDAHTFEDGPVRMALHNDSSMPLLRQAQAQLDRFNHDTPPSERGRYRLRWKVSRDTWRQFRQEWDHAWPVDGPERGVLPSLPDGRVRLLGIPVERDDLAAGVALVVEWLRCSGDRHEYRYRERQGIVCGRCGMANPPLPRSLIAALSADVRRQTAQAATFAAAMNRLRGCANDAAGRFQHLDVPPHPRTRAINDEFGWADAHNMTAGRDHDEWTGDPIE